MKNVATEWPVAWVFDLDGTLVDSLPGIEGALRAAFGSLGYAWPAGNVRDAIGPSLQTMVKQMAPALTDVEASAIAVAYRSVYDESGWRETFLFAGVAATLEALHDAGCRLFVATNKPHIPALKILKHLSLLRWFDGVHTRDAREPHFADKTAMLRDLLATYEIAARDAAMVGDTAEDEAAAAASGLRFFFMSHGYGEARGAVERIDRFADLLHWSPKIGVRP